MESGLSAALLDPWPQTMEVWNRRSEVHGIRLTNHQQVLPKNLFAAIGKQKRQIEVSSAVVESAAMDPAGVYARLATRAIGLTTEEAARRLAEHYATVSHNKSLLRSWCRGTSFSFLRGI